MWTEFYFQQKYQFLMILLKKHLLEKCIEQKMAPEPLPNLIALRG